MHRLGSKGCEKASYGLYRSQEPPEAVVSAPIGEVCRRSLAVVVRGSLKLVEGMAEKLTTS